LCVLVGGVLLVGCGSSSSGSGVDSVKPLALTGGHAVIGKLSITGAYIPDPATPSLAAAYFTVTNAGSADTLRSIDIAAFRSAMLNRYVTASDGAESMVAVNGGVTIPAHGRLVLHPGSYHVMLQHPIHPIKQGMTTRLTLTFARAGRVSMVVPVVADTGLPGGGSGSDDNSMPGMKMSGSGG
jgi:copper(I)-binding protein